MDSPSNQSFPVQRKLERRNARKVADYEPSDRSLPTVGSPLSYHYQNSPRALDRDASGSFRVTGRDSQEEIQSIAEYLGLSGGADAFAIPVAAWDAGKIRRRSFDHQSVATVQTRLGSLDELPSGKQRHFGSEAPRLRSQSPDSSPQPVFRMNPYSGQSSMSSEDSFSSDGSKSPLELSQVSVSPSDIIHVSFPEDKPMHSGVRVSGETEESISSVDSSLKLLRTRSEEASSHVLATETLKCSSMEAHRSTLPPPPPIRSKPRLPPLSTYDLLEGLAPEGQRESGNQSSLTSNHSILTRQSRVLNPEHHEGKGKWSRERQSQVNEPTSIPSNHQSKFTNRSSDQEGEPDFVLGSHTEALRLFDVRQQSQVGRRVRKHSDNVIEQATPVARESLGTAARVADGQSVLADDRIPSVESYREMQHLNGGQLGQVGRTMQKRLPSRTEQATPISRQTWGASADLRLEENVAIIEIQAWRKLDLLGSGSFGMVYEAMSEEGVYFAVKEVSLSDKGSSAQQSISQLEQEIAVLSKYQHENIVRYLGTEKGHDKLYIFLEYVTKGSLASLYQKHELFNSQIQRYTRQILNGLKYLHDNNIVHRDIKCANILVDANGKVKLADFGLAKQISEIDVLKSCKGTAHWMAPEVIDPRKTYSFPADIWSLGCTVLEMATRRPPFGDMEMHRALWKIAHGEAPTIPLELSEDAQDFIRSCLQPNPDERPTAGKLLEHPFVRHVGGSGRSSFSPEAAPDRLQDHSS